MFTNSILPCYALLRSIGLRQLICGNSPRKRTRVWQVGKAPPCISSPNVPISHYALSSSYNIHAWYILPRPTLWSSIAAFINGHKERPSQEPLFPQWTWTEIANKCQDLTSSSSEASSSSSSSSTSSLPPKWVFYNRTHEWCIIILQSTVKWRALR